LREWWSMRPSVVSNRKPGQRAKLADGGSEARR
jgi:hypothetical protein